MSTAPGAAVAGELDVLGEARFFSGLGRARLARLALLARRERYAQDTRIYSLGDPAEDFYVLADGMVRFTLGVGRRDTSAGEIIRRGEVFGWAALVETTQRRIATAYCLTACEVLALDGARLIALMETDHSLGYELMKQLSVLLTSELKAFAAG
ncbi:MAG TPA: cyclic nucleotide-binding domain-containing protein [Burkholderiales bacterium]|nr:cyclic nucleotide-binding domain-containing protein [Burkholderiales bacterium]